MKIFLLGLLFLLIQTSVFGNEIGKGDLKISNNIFNYFLKYIEGGFSGPMVFLTTKKGDYAHYWYCPVGSAHQCETPVHATTLCKERMQKQLGYSSDCFIFAEQRRVVWDNGNNFSVEERIINSEWSDQKIRDKFTQLGFFGDSIKSNTEKKIDYISKKPKNTNSLKFNKDNPSKVVDDLKRITEMYEKGLLTKEEFEKSKSILLR
jgi:hypothetical protein